MPLEGAKKLERGKTRSPAARLEVTVSKGIVASIEVVAFLRIRKFMVPDPTKKPLQYLSESQSLLAAMVLCLLLLLELYPFNLTYL